MLQTMGAGPIVATVALVVAVVILVVAVRRKSRRN